MVDTPYPDWVLGIAIAMILAGVLPIPLVFLLRRYQCLKMDYNIHEGSIRRIDTTVSTKEMITDVDVSKSAYYNLNSFTQNLSHINALFVVNK